MYKKFSFFVYQLIGYLFKFSLENRKERSLYLFLAVAEYEEGSNLEKTEETKEPITALQAAWNVTNAIQGMFIVGLPVAVKVSYF